MHTDTYNGYPNYDYWNVALWLANEESWYRLVQAAFAETLDADGSHHDAVVRICAALPAVTPDGSIISIARVTYATEEDWDEFLADHRADHHA